MLIMIIYVRISTDDQEMVETTPTSKVLYCRYEDHKCTRHFLLTFKLASLFNIPDMLNITQI